MSEMVPRRVVFTPDILLAALFDPRAREILNEWRDGKIVVVVNRELLLAYVKALHQAGLGPDLIRKWSLWFTSPTRAIYSDATSDGQIDTQKLCEHLAVKLDAQLITMPH